MGVRAPFYLEGATLVFSVKKLRVLREEKKKLRGLRSLARVHEEKKECWERWKGS